MCCGNNPNEACGYPPKTVRATISVFICIVTFLVLAFLVIFFAIKEEYTNSMGVAAMLNGEVGTVIGYYFGSRSQQEVKDQIERELEKKNIDMYGESENLMTNAEEI